MHFIWYNIYPYFHNLGLLYENLKKAQGLWCVQNDVTVRVFKTEGPIIPTELQATHITYNIMTSLWDYENIWPLCPPYSNFFSPNNISCR